jgi:hypothetical protein
MGDGASALSAGVVPVGAGRVSVAVSGPPEGTPIVIDVLDESFAQVSEIVARVGETATIDVPGSCTLRARAPSGARVSARVVIEGDDASPVLALELPPSPYQWVAQQPWAQPAGPGGPKGSGEVEASLRAALRGFALGPDGWREIDAAAVGDAAVRVLTVSPAEAPWSGAAGRLCGVLCAGAGSTRFTLLPTFGGAVQVVRGAPRKQGDPPVIAISRPGDPEMESLLGYAQKGDARGLALVAAGLDPERRLPASGEAGDPAGAALGAYVLLRLGPIERLRGWTGRLFEVARWLPDAGIVRAQQRLLEGAAAPELLSYVRAAVDAGPPIFAAGMRVLGDLLALLEAEAPADVRALSARIAVARSRWVPSVPFTTFETRGETEDPGDAKSRALPGAWRVPPGRADTGPGGTS